MATSAVGKFRPEVLHLVGRVDVPNQAAGEEASGAQQTLQELAPALCCTHPMFMKALE